jgi:pimeloyl-ACP methyl ester carboxylesterase
MASLIYRRHRLVFAAVAVLITLSGHARAQDPLPRLEPAECPIPTGDWSRDTKIECKWLLVPESRGKTNSRVIKLGVIILRARQPDGSVPLVMLHGGPGGSGIQSYTRGAVGARLDEHRDVVIYDQRASGFSQPKLCPQDDGIEEQAQKLKTREEREKLWSAADYKCWDWLDAQKIDRASYSTIASTYDLIDLRKALGYSTWDVYGGSYGARLAQYAMKEDAKAIRSAVLASPTLRGPATQAEGPLSAQRAIEQVFADCTAQTDCQAAFPTLSDDFYAVYDDLMKSPIAVQREGSDSETIWLDGTRFISRIRNDILKRSMRLAQFPMIVNELRRGDKMRAARTLVGGGNAPGADTGDQVLLHLITCYDVFGKEYLAQRKAANSQVRAPFQKEDDLSVCRQWQKSSGPTADYAPVRSDIPTLILTGRYDDRTTTALAKRIAATLSRAYQFEFPNEGHGQRPAGCHLSIMKKFWENPLQEPDRACIDKIPKIRFLTTWPEPRAGAPPRPLENK